MYVLAEQLDELEELVADDTEPEEGWLGDGVGFSGSSGLSGSAGSAGSAGFAGPGGFPPEGGGKLLRAGNFVKSIHSGSSASRTGNSILQVASMTVSTTLFATFATTPRKPPGLGLGKGLHLSVGSSILAKTTAKLSSSSFLCLTFMVGTAPRSVILGM